MLHVYGWRRDGGPFFLNNPRTLEARIDSGDLLLTQVCRSDHEIEDVSSAWKGAMIEKSWR